MKTKILLTTVSTFLILHFAFGQGALTPPGAPAPTMKTLAQIEPRTPIAALPFNITQPGSYYLTTNLTQAINGGGIFITSANVTLDLNGFALLGANSGTTNGITLSGSIGNITVGNGAIAGWGGAGVEGYLLAPNTVNELFEHLTVSGNFSSGISAGPGSLIRDCLSVGNAAGGGLVGGLSSRGGEIRDCVARGNSAYGIYVAPGVVTGCVVQNNVRSGIYVNLPNSVIQQNTCTGNDAGAFANEAGIYLNDSNNRIEANYVVTPSSIPGLVSAPGYFNNVVIKNVVSGNGANNYVGTAGNDFGPIGTAATATSPWANISH